MSDLFPRISGVLLAVYIGLALLGAAFMTALYVGAFYASWRALEWVIG